MVEYIDKCEKVMLGHTGSVNIIRFTSDGSYCMTGSDDRTVSLWNPHKDDSTKYAAGNALLVKTYAGVHGYPIRGLAISTDKSKFVSAGDDRAFFYNDVMSGNVIRRIQGHSQRINAVAMNLDNTVALTASYDSTVSCWDLRSNNREPIQVLKDFRDSVTCVVTTRFYIIAGSTDGRVNIYDIRKGLLNSDNFSEPVTSVSVSEDERCYLVSCLGGNIPLVELASGRRLAEYQGHTHSSFKMESSFEHNNKEVLSSSEDGVIFHWNMTTAAVSGRTMHAHTKGISSVSYHPNKDMFLTASYDGSAKVWQHQECAASTI